MNIFNHMQNREPNMYDSKSQEGQLMFNHTPVEETSHQHTKHMFNK